jgi:hypothetical protein
MKKILVLFLSLITLFSLVACAGGEEGGDDADNGKPRYEAEYTFDETHHWREQINGYGKTDYEEHENDQGRCECGLYYDCTHMLDFQKVKLGDVEGYMVTGYKDEDYFGANLYLHYDVPTHYQGEDDEEPLPVISLGPGAFSVGTVNAVNYNDVPIFSVRLHEGLLEIQDWCFKGSEITELIIPDGVSKICDYAFYEIRMKSLTMPDSVEKIGKNAYKTIYENWNTATTYKRMIQFINELQEKGKCELFAEGPCSKAEPLSHNWYK